MAKSSKQVVLITGGAMGQGRTHAVAVSYTHLTLPTTSRV